MVLHPYLGRLLAEAHINDLRRDAAPGPARKAARDATARAQDVADLPITIRLAHPGDTGALTRLAELDSARRPAPPLLLAEAGGTLRAALSLSDGEIIADPFRPSDALKLLLIARAAQLRGTRAVRPRRFSRLAYRGRRRARSGRSSGLHPMNPN